MKKQITSLLGMDFKSMTFHSATGKLEYTLTNDFLFKAVLQNNKKVLKALVASLMHLKMNEITSIEITNPIEPGNSVTSKTFNLDIRLILNGTTIVNLEMQVLNKGFWSERSVSYLARSFDNLERGDDYGQVKSVIHIGFFDFDLPDVPAEFYGTYQLLNVKNGTKYSGRFTLSVVNLKHTDLATEEDKKYHIDKWAALFKATTWEEIKMIAGKDEYLNEASSELFRLCAEDAVRAECEARERYYREQEYMNKRIAKLEKEGKEKDNLLAQKDQTIAEKNYVIAALNAEKEQAIDALNAEIKKLKEQLKKDSKC